jgi:5-methylcytosine-specific restriction enzyme A
MRDKQGFKTWLDSNPRLSENSKRRYANAIDQLSRKYGVALYGATDTKGVDSIMSDPTFESFNNEQGHMFSASLNHFKSFINYCNKVDEEEIHTAILRAKIEYEKNQKKVNPRRITKKDIIDKAEKKPPYTLVKGRKVWKRNPAYATEAVMLADYLCEVDNNHKHFISKTTEQNYVEAHHLIPIRFQDKHEHSLDIHSNIVSVCVACHKQLHHGFF